MGPLRPRPASQPASQPGRLPHSRSAGTLAGRTLTPPKTWVLRPRARPEVLHSRKGFRCAPGPKTRKFFSPARAGDALQSQRRPVTGIGDRSESVRTPYGFQCEATNHKRGAATETSRRATAHPRRCRPHGPLGSGPGGAPEREGGGLFPHFPFSRFTADHLRTRKQLPEAFLWGWRAVRPNQPQRKTAGGCLRESKGRR